MGKGAGILGEVKRFWVVEATEDDELRCLKGEMMVLNDLAYEHDFI